MGGIQPFDIVVIVLALGMAIRGGLSGIISQLFSLFSIFGSWYLASRYYLHIEAMLPQNEVWGKPVAMLIVFVAANIGFRLLSMMFQRAINVSNLKEFDRQLGALLGLFKGVVLSMIVTFFAVTLTDVSRNAVAASQSGKYLVALILEVDVILPDDPRHEPIKEQIAKFKEMADAAKIENVSITDDITKLKKKLTETVIDPEAKDLTVPVATASSDKAAAGSSSGNSFFSGLVDKWNELKSGNSKNLSKTGIQNGTQGGIPTLANSSPSEMTFPDEVSSSVNPLLTGASNNIQPYSTSPATNTALTSAPSAQYHASSGRVPPQAYPTVIDFSTLPPPQTTGGGTRSGTNSGSGSREAHPFAQLASDPTAGGGNDLGEALSVQLPNIGTLTVNGTGNNNAGNGVTITANPQTGNYQINYQSQGQLRTGSIMTQQTFTPQTVAPTLPAPSASRP